MRKPKAPMPARPSLPKEDKELLKTFLATPEWRCLERLLSDEINLAIAANLRVGAEHDYYIGVVDGLSVVFDILARADEEEPVTDFNLVTKLDPATSGWLPQFRQRCQHRAVTEAIDPATLARGYSCRSCGKTWKEEHAARKGSEVSGQDDQNGEKDTSSLQRGQGDRSKKAKTKTKKKKTQQT